MKKNATGLRPHDKAGRCPFGPCPDCPDRPDGLMLEPCLETMLRRERRWQKRQTRKLRKKARQMTNMQLYSRTEDAVAAWLLLGGSRDLDDWLREDAAPEGALLHAARRVVDRFTRGDVNLEPGLRTLVMQLDAAVARFPKRRPRHDA